MKLHRLLTFAILFSVGTSLTIAQESIRLKFEVVKDGSTVAQPEVSVTSDSASRIEIDGVGQFAFTPTFRGSDTVAIAFDIQSGGKQLQPRLVIGKSEPGTLSWTSETRAQSFKLRVSWIR
jgi:hypothetical protein